MVAHLEIELKYFLALTVPLTVITWLCYQCMVLSIYIWLIFMFTAQTFLQLRFEGVADRIRKFHKVKKRVQNRRRRQITQTINDIVRQFNAANLLFDDLL